MCPAKLAGSFGFEAQSKRAKATAISCSCFSCELSFLQSLVKFILIALHLALQTPFLTINHLMSSQTGNLQDLATCSGHPSPFIIGPEVEPDSLSRQEFAQHSQLPSGMGLRFMTIPVSDDAQYVYFVPCCCAPLDSTVGHLHMFSSLPKRFVYAGTFPLSWDQSEALTPNP
jgi:hypothetical protein